MSSPYYGLVMLPIAAGSDIQASIWTEKGCTFVAVAGPCGGHHKMSLVEAGRLKDWLEANLPKKAAEPPELTEETILTALEGIRRWIVLFGAKVRDEPATAWPDVT